MPNFLDLSNRRINRWTVLKEAGRNKWGQAIWHCRCECGTERVVQSTALVQGHTNSCGCYKRDKLRKLRSPLGSVAFNRLYGRYKGRAKFDALEFSLTKQELAHVCSQACYYCGSLPSQIELGHPTLSHPRDTLAYNGIDRRDNSRGYVIDNVLPCCKRCNWAKRDLSESDFLDLVARIHGHRIKR
jgi:hypothetical protein